MFRFAFGLLTSLFVASTACAQDSYAFAQYGTATLDYSHRYVTAARMSAPSHTVGLGKHITDTLSIELAFHDFGTYRFVGEKTFNGSVAFSVGPFAFSYAGSLALPGYVEARAYGESIGLRYAPQKWFNAKLAVVHATAEAELHTPLGYAMYKRSALLPLGSVGLAWGNFTVDYATLPRMKIVTAGVKVEF